MHRLITLVALLCIAGLLQAQEKADKPEETADKPVTKIGVYDSRCVAYAHFWTDEYQRKHNEHADNLKAAKKSGDAKELEKWNKIVWDERRGAHRQVFSTAPVDEILDEIKDRLPEIKNKTGVSLFISKWDESKLKQFKSAEKMDVTDLLVQEFKLPQTEKHKKVLDEMKKVKPVPLDQVDKIE
jgi:hypothetical protein